MKYDILKEEESKTVEATTREVFRTTIIARTEGCHMNEEEKFVYELIFKPGKPELRLRTEDIQLLLSYFEEMLKQIEGR